MRYLPANAIRGKKPSGLEVSANPGDASFSSNDIPGDTSLQTSNRMFVHLPIVKMSYPNSPLVQPGPITNLQNIGSVTIGSVRNVQRRLTPFLGGNTISCRNTDDGFRATISGWLKSQPISWTSGGRKMNSAHCVATPLVSPEGDL